ncbi:MAG: energy-coupling factor transporter transmembrane protein EcfT [Lachnospiraceae bacterium]|nr:energy-coupling factor transporter transmembrane protein EcfT [Lachnospiraceae bacterium]
MSKTIRCSEFHPVVNFCYILGMILITMSNMNPVIIAVSFISSFLYMIYLDGVLHIKRIIFISLPILLFSVIIMPLFYHNGVTPLFYVNDMQVTLEAVLYGIVMTFLLLSVMQLFFIWNKWISSEKFLYLFGKISPNISLVLSMVFRMVPLMIKRWHDIHDAQKGMGCTAVNSIIGRMKQFVKEISILISWCLENSIDTSISMESRGYGIGKRTSFHRFRWHIYDIITIVTIIPIIILIFVSILNGGFMVNFFPEININQFSLYEKVLAVVYGVYAVMPLLIESFNINTYGG